MRAGSRVTCLSACLALLAACGYEAVGNELEGQVKKVIRHTPVFCGDYTETSVSLGVLRNGVGSVSKEDVELYVADPKAISVLQEAARTGALVTIGYDVRRLTWCLPDHWLTSVRVEEPPAERRTP
jgi:hypothetical protein